MLRCLVPIQKLIFSAYNPYFSAYFFSQNSILLSQQISQPCFSAGLISAAHRGRSSRRGRRDGWDGSGTVKAAG
jgi:hypothetical protein